MPTFALVLALLSVSTAVAQQPPPTASRRSAPSAKPDPNEIVCQTWRETGSRLRANRYCATRAQWAEHIRQERQYVERAQTNRTY